MRHCARGRNTQPEPAACGQIAFARKARGLPRVCRRPQVRNADHQRHRLERRFVKTQLEVETPGLFGNGMHDQATDADGISGIDDAASRVLEQGAAKTLAVMGARDRESSEDYDGNRIGHVAAKVSWGAGRRDRRRCQGVVADYMGLVAHNKGARRSADLIGHGAALEPGVKRFDTAVETRDDVVEREQLGGAKHLCQVAAQGASARIVFWRSLLGCAG